ncbi:hypothetical protein D3C75_696090 [compost metagenome]
MAEQESFGAGTHGTGSQNKLTVLELHNLTADNPGHGDPACNSQRQNNRPQAWFHDYEQQDNHQQIRNGVQNFGNFIHDVIYASAKEAHDSPVNNTDQQVNRRCGQTDKQGNTRPVPGTDKDITAQIIGAKPMFR